MFNPEIKANNGAMLNGLVSDDPYLRKEASNGVRDFLRMRAREDGFLRQILPPITVTREDLTKQVDTNKPVIVKEKEPSSPGAYSMPFGKVPIDHYMDTPKYRVMFDRVASDRFVADVANLLTYDLDIRKVFNDLMLKDILDEEDRKFLAAVDTVLGSLNATSSQRVTDTGAMGWVTVGSLNRVSLTAFRKGLASCDNKLNPAVALINNVTIWDVVSLGRDAVGGDAAEAMFLNGFTAQKIMGLDWIVTIKSALVPDNVAYQFTSPEALGDFFVLEDLTIWTEHKAYMFEMFAYETIGGAIGNSAGACKSSFTGSFNGWRPTGGSSS
jgi:hypothetical protein